MAYQTLKNTVLRQWIAYFSLCCLLTSHLPAQLCAESCPCVCRLVEPEDAQRARTATLVAGATIAVLIGGIAYFTLGSLGHGHHSSCSSSSSSYRSNSPSYYHHHSHSGSHYYYSPYSSKSHHSHHSDTHYVHENSITESFTDPQFLDRGSTPFFDRGNLPARCRTTAFAKRSKASNQLQLSGTFISHVHLSTSNRGSCTAFIQLPDGTTEVLGSIDFAHGTGASLAYGPFTQKGSYAFGIRVDAGTQLCTQAKVGLEINKNGSVVQSGEFLIPAHPCASYEPNLYYFDF